MSGPGSDLDAGLDAGLETHPRATVMLLAAAPLLLALGHPAVYVLAAIPALWFADQHLARRPR